MVDVLNDLLTVLDSTLRLATPLLLACLAGLFSERAGIFDIGLEGKMLAAAFFSAAAAALTGSVWIGLASGIAASLALSAVHGLASITFRGNQLISGVAINFLAAGMTVLIAQSLFQQGGRTPSLSGQARFNPVDLPFAEQIETVPLLGTYLCRAFFWPHNFGLCSFGHGAPDVVAFIPHPIWVALARRWRGARSR
jgi:simple sugar transport system permease protein